MAASSYSSKLSESKYRNWVKAALGVLITKEGITPFVCDEIEQFQQKCLSDICNNNGLPAGTTCSSCCTGNVLFCPTKGICYVRQWQCSFHSDYATQYIPSGCPGKICHNFKNEIQKAHRFHGPSYRNTDATQWCSNPWEVAKCFMPPDGYKDVVSAAETDFNGINSVIINFKDFQPKVHADLSKKNNIFDEAREVGKAVRHSPALEVDDTDLQQYFAVLQNLLSDPGQLSANTYANKAKQKLSQLLNDTLVIGKEDIRKMLDDAGRAAHDKIKLELIKVTENFIDDIVKEGKCSMLEVNKALRSAVDEVEKETNKGVKRIRLEYSAGMEKVQESVDTAIKKMETQTDYELKMIDSEAEKGAKRVEMEVDAGVNRLSSKAEEAVHQIGEKMATNNEENYNKLKYARRSFLMTSFTSDLLHNNVTVLDCVLDRENSDLVNIGVVYRI